MIHEDFTPRVERDSELPSRLILFPFSTFESFCEDEWVGRESEWFSILNILHRTMSYVMLDSTTIVLLLHPDPDRLAEILGDHLDDSQLLTIRTEGEDLPAHELATLLDERPLLSLDVILATEVFGTGASRRDEARLLRACHRALKDDGYLLATFPLQDRLGNTLTAQNVQFLDAAASAGFEQNEISSCDGITGYLDSEFWKRLRRQGRPAFDTVLNAFSVISDDPSALWMGRTAFYAGQKR